MATERDALLDEVMWRGSIPDAVRAQAAIEAVLDAVARHLSDPDRAFLAERLPAPYAPAVRRPSMAAASRPDDLYAQLATREEVSLGLAIEHARAACSGIAEVAGAETRALLARRLPPDWAVLLTPAPSAEEAGVPRGPLPGYGHTLATGKPGSSRPLSEAEPPGNDGGPRRA